MRKPSLTSLFRHSVLILVLVVSGISCSQYEYASPSPGILEIRLKTKNSRTDLMPFGLSGLVINLKDLKTITSSSAKLDVLPDINAIRRSSDGDFFNALDTLARDSAIVLGKVYSPPATYTGIDIVAQFAGNTVFIAGVAGTFIAIPIDFSTPPPPALNQLPREGQSLSFTVNEGRLTRVNVMLDLDSTLIRRTETFRGDLQFYISSIQNF